MTKRLFDLNDKNDDKARELTKGLIERGMLIEAGFALYSMKALKIAAPQVAAMDAEQFERLSDIRDAYRAGAEHLFSSIMSTYDEGDEPTPADERRLALIDAEVEGIRAELWNKVHTAKGSA